MSDDPLIQLLRHHGVSASIIKDIEKVHLSDKERQLLYDKYKDKTKSQFLLGLIQFVTQKKEKEAKIESQRYDISKIENTPLFLTLKPVMGTALAAETIDFLTSVYKDFNQPETQKMYMDFIKSVPKKDRMPVVFSTLKVANMAKISMAENYKDDYVGRDNYQNVDMLISHTLPAIYSWGSAVKEFVFEIRENENLARKLVNNPLSYARSLLFNESFCKVEDDFAKAKQQIYGITNSCGDNKLDKLHLFIDESVKVSKESYGMADYRKASLDERMELLRKMLRTPVNCGMCGGNQVSAGRYG